MSSFTRELVLKYDPKTNLWETARAFSYYVGSEDSEDEIRVEKGFKTDLASVPWPATLFIPKSGSPNQAAVLHDHLYFHLGDDPKGTHRTRKACDRIFMEAMKVLGVPWWKRTTMYAAVRVGGWAAWKKGFPPA